MSTRFFGQSGVIRIHRLSHTVPNVTAPPSPQILRVISVRILHTRTVFEKIPIRQTVVTPGDALQTPGFSRERALLRLILVKDFAPLGLDPVLVNQRVAPADFPCVQTVDFRPVPSRFRSGRGELAPFEVVDYPPDDVDVFGVHVVFLAVVHVELLYQHVCWCGQPFPRILKCAG